MDQRCRAWKQSCQQLGHPMAAHPLVISRRVQRKRPPPVIVAELNQRRAAPTSSREPMPRIEAAAIIQMRRLQEGSDADGATVARPKWTGFSPLDDMLEGNTTPPTGKRRPMTSPSLRLSPKNPLARTSGHEPDPLPANTAIVAVPPPHGSPFRGASTRRLHAAAAQLRRPSPLRPGHA